MGKDVYGNNNNDYTNPINNNYYVWQ